MNKKAHNILYLIGDLVSISFAWALFYGYRKIINEPSVFGYNVPLIEANDINFYLGVILIPVLYLSVFGIFGSYRNVFKKSRIKELGNIFLVSVFCSLLIFFTIILDDIVASYAALRTSFFVYFFTNLSLLLLVRMTHLTILKNQLKNRKYGFNTILVGSTSKAFELFETLEKKRFSEGYRFIGYVSIENGASKDLSSQIPFLGLYTEIPKLVKQHKVEEVILACDRSESSFVDKILSLVADVKVSIKILPDMYDLVTGTVKMNYIFGTALIEVNPEIMPIWQQNLKRVIDVIASIFFIFLFFPLYLILALAVKLNSKGPIFYKQERIGLNSKPFFIIKFRSMYIDAEQKGPQLSSENDPRITPIGRTLRKYRLDEIPQFFNVIKGEMSLVGPRPERAYYINEIIKEAPQYIHLLKVKPGITSWGQIKYGYAENVQQMIERMKFDILYIENMSLAMDFKILFYTVLIIFQGRGK